MRKSSNRNIIIFVIFGIISLVAGFLIQEYDNRYRSFSIIEAPLGEEIESNTFEELNENKEEKLYIDINTDSVSELDKLDGIGEKMAQRIIEYRKENGDFEVIEDLMRVSGIGEKKFDAVKDNIYVGDGEE